MKKFTAIAFVLLLMLAVGISTENLFIQSGPELGTISETIILEDHNEIQICIEQELPIAEADLSVEALHDNSENHQNSEDVYASHSTFGIEDGCPGITAPKHLFYPHIDI